MSLMSHKRLPEWQRWQFSKRLLTREFMFNFILCLEKQPGTTMIISVTKNGMIGWFDRFENKQTRGSQASWQCGMCD